MLTFIIHSFWQKRWISCLVDSGLKDRSAHTLCGNACSCQLMKPLQYTAVHRIV